MFNLQLSAEQIEFRDTVRAFTEQEVRPAAIQSDRLQGYRPALLETQLKQASQMGLRTLALSEQRGGAGADALTSCIVMAELGAGDVGIASILAETSALAHALFDEAMNDAQRARWLPAFAADDSFHLAGIDAETPVDAEWCYHRPSATVPAALNARRESNGDWVLNGSIAHVANAPLAKCLVVSFCADGRRMSVLLPCEADGLAVVASPARPQWFHGASGDVTFANCRVAAADVLPRALSGDAPAARLARSAINLGLARGAYEAALRHAQLKVQGARRIVEHEGVGLMLAEMLVRLEAARSQLWQTAWAIDHPEAVGDRSLPDLPLLELTGVFVAEAAHEVTVRASEVFGAMGILRDMPLFQFVHDAQVFLHAGAGVTAAKLAIAERIDDYVRPLAAVDQIGAR